MGLSSNNVLGLNNKYNLIEWCVIFTVFCATVSLYFFETTEQEPDLELTTIHGNIQLSTRESMDAFGLENFKTGPIANLNLTNLPVITNKCQTCHEEIIGTMLSGAIIISELYDFENRKGRVEGSFNFTHLVERVDDYIIHEWVIFDWNAGDITSSWELKINHNPPRWVPKYDSTSLFIGNEIGFESRSGPEILIQNTDDNVKLIQACLPDSFLCRNTSPDAILIAGFDNKSKPITISPPMTWLKQNISHLSPSDASSELIDNALNRGDIQPNQLGFLPSQYYVMDNASTYELLEFDSKLSPLSLWFSALDLIPISFNLAGHSLVYMNNSSVDCYNILDQYGNIIIGLMLK